MHPGAVSGDDDGVFGDVDVNRLVERHRRGVRPRLPVWPAERKLIRIRIRIGHKGFAQRDVELHRPGIGGAGPGGRRQHPAGGRAPLGVEHLKPLGARLGQAGADRRAHLGAEVTQLLHGLVGPGAQHLVGPVGAQHDQRDPGVVGLDDGRTQVGHRGTGRHRDRDRPTAARGQADGQEAGGALVDPHVEPQPARPVGVGQGERQRCVAGTGAQHHVGHAAANEFVDDDAGLGRRGIHAYQRVTSGFRRKTPAWRC